MTSEYECVNCGQTMIHTRAVPDVPELVRYDMKSTFPESNGFNEKRTMRKDKSGKYVRYDQAAAVIAAKEAEIKSLNEECDDLVKRNNQAVETIDRWIDSCSSLEECAEAAEAKLAQSEKQEAVGTQVRVVWDDGRAPSKWADGSLETHFAPSTAAHLEERYVYAAPVASDAESWKYAFAAQSRKLQAVLHIEGVKEILAELRDTDLTSVTTSDADLRALALEISQYTDPDYIPRDVFHRFRAALNPSESRT